MHELYNVKFDPEKIIGHFGSVMKASQALKAIGLNVKAKTLQKQRERGNMTADVIASLALASVKLRRQLDLYECLVVRRTWEEDEEDRVNGTQPKEETNGDEQCSDLNIQDGMTRHVD